MKIYLYALPFALLVLISSYGYGYENQCEPLFKNGLESHRPGTIRFGWAAELNGGGYELNARRVIQNRWNTPCDGHACVANGVASAAFPDVQADEPSAKGEEAEDRKGKRQEHQKSDDHRKDSHQKKKTLSSYYVPAFGESELPLDNGVLQADSVAAGAFSTLIFKPGDYWLNSLYLGFRSEIISEGEGQVRIFVKKIVVGSSALIGNEDFYPLIHADEFYLGSFSQVHAFIYTNRDAGIASFATLSGALSGDSIGLDAFATVTYNPDKLRTINYGWICDYDGDGQYDAFDPDADNDGFSNEVELIAGTDPYDPQSLPKDTDGDGIADVVDEDADNDGYTNEEEIAEGTDPYDASSYPLPDPPQLSLTTEDNQTLYADTVTITGKVTVGDLPIAHVSISVAGAAYPVSINEQGYFSVLLPLQEGENSFVIEVVDQQGYQASATLTVTYIVPFILESVEPSSGTTMTEASPLVTAVVKAVSRTPYVRIGDTNLQRISQDGDRYIFSAPVKLEPGNNLLTLTAHTSDRSISQPLTYRYEPDDAEYPAPVIHIALPASGARTNKDSIAFYAEVSSRTGRLQATLNGNAVSVRSLGNDLYSVAESVDLNEGGNTLSLSVIDALDKQTQADVICQQDKKGPEIELSNGWLVAPDINVIAGNTVQLEGRLNDPDVNSLSVNGSEVPLNSDGQGFTFSYALKIPALQEVPVHLLASDDLGNKSTEDYYLYTESSLEMSWISPSFPITWYTERGTGYPFAVKLERESGDENYSVMLEPLGQNIAVQKIAGILTGTLPDQLPAGDYQLIVSADLGARSIEIAGAIAVRNQEDIPLQIVNLIPANHDENVEPDVPLQISFNRPVKPENLTFSVKQTLHGKTYVNVDEPGEDFLHSKGYQLQEVHLSRADVPGGISLVSSDQVALYYPKQDLGYGATVYWDVFYKGELVGHQVFTTRNLPTFIEGGVIDSLGQSRADVIIELQELSQQAVTNKDGGYTFGYKAAASENIADGEYHLIANPARRDPSLGTVSVPVSITGGVLNELPLIRIPNISQEILPVPVEQNATTVRLAAGKLVLSLNGAGLSFPEGEHSIHAQFVPAGSAVRDTMEGLMPLWFYQLQPFGIKPSGPIDLSLKLPMYMGSYQYLPGAGELDFYVLMLGYNEKKNIIEPIGVGKISDKVLTSIRPVSYQTLDYIGYSVVLPAQQALVEKYINNELSFTELTSSIMLENL